MVPLARRRGGTIARRAERCALACLAIERPVDDRQRLPIKARRRKAMRSQSIVFARRVSNEIDVLRQLAEIARTSNSRLPADGPRGFQETESRFGAGVYSRCSRGGQSRRRSIQTALPNAIAGVSPTHKRCITSRRESKIQVMPTPHSRAMTGSSDIATRTCGHDQRLRHFTAERKTIRAATPPASRIQATSLH